MTEHTTNIEPRASTQENLKAVIAGNISTLRRRQNMTQLDLAEKLNYTDKAISKWERGESIPDITVLKAIADLFGVSVDYLLTSVHESALETPEPPVSNRSLRTCGFVTGMSILLVWLVATVIFTILHSIPADIRALWMIFAYAVPASLILWLILNSIWFNRRRNYLIISLIMWSLLLIVYLAVWIYAARHIWMVFMLGLPGQAIIVMWSRLKQKDSLGK